MASNTACDVNNHSISLFWLAGIHSNSTCVNSQTQRDSFVQKDFKQLKIRNGFF